MLYNTVIKNLTFNDLKSKLKVVALNHSESIDGDNLGNNICNPKRCTFASNLNFTINNRIDNTNDENIDKVRVKDAIEKFIISNKDTFQERTLCVGETNLQSAIFYENLGRNSEIEGLHVRKTRHTLPLAYDVLLNIFISSDQNLRQKHFRELIHYYYSNLKDNLKDAANILPLHEFKIQIHKYLPLVKMEMVCRLSEGPDNKNKNLLDTCILELTEAVLYPKLSREDCYEIVQNKIGSTDYGFISYTLTPVKERVGFLGEYYKLEIKIRYQHKDQVLDCFAKYLPTSNESAIETAGIAFKKEAFVYQTLIPELNSFGLEGLTDFLPKCYFVRLNDVLIFEDVSLVNYKSIDISLSYNYECLHAVIQRLAKFHACSLLYEEIMTKKTGKVVRINDVFKEFTEEMEFQVEIDDKRKKRMVCGIRSFLTYGLDAFPDILKTLTRDEFLKRSNAVFNLLFEKVKASNKYRNVLCHGDFWASNILFITDDSGSPLDCCIIDYQLTRYCPPAEDLLYLFYFNTTKETRTKHMPTLINHYYKELADLLDKYCFDLNEIYTLEHFQECCNYMKSAVICQASLILQFNLYPSDKMDKIVNDNEKMEYIFNVDRKELFEELHNPGPYRDRIREIMEDLYDICENQYGEEIK